MCKKVYFRRRLEAGKDVFNVKSPSKQNPYQLYLENKDNFAYKPGKKGKPDKKEMDYVSLLEHHDKIKARRLKDLGEKPSVARKRRMIQYIPKDFRMNQVSVNEGSVGKEEGYGEVKPALMTKLQNERIMKQLHERELFNLKAQIKLKRMANKRVKQIRKMVSEKSAVDIVAGTSLKGRKRKMNTKYGPDFALSKTEVEQFVTIAKLQRQMEKGRKSLNNLKRRMSAKNSNDIDLVIDNAESSQVKKVKTEAVVPGSEKKGKDEGKLKVKFTQGGKLQRKTLKTRRKSADMGDGVLIRDMPAEGQLISGLLANPDPKTPTCKPNPSVTEIPSVTKSDTHCTDQYTFAKSLLRCSLLAKNEIDEAGENRISEIKKILSKPNTFHMTPDMEMDKAKKLRIPENVQRLFKVKTEPVDPDTSASVSSPSVSYSALNTFTQTVVSPKRKSNAFTQNVAERTAEGSGKKPITYTTLPTNVIGTPVSPKKTIVFPSVVRQPTPATSAPPLLLKAGSLPIPVTIKSGPNGDKVITVLVSSTPSTEQLNIVQVSQGVANTSNLDTPPVYCQSLKTLGSQSIIYTNFPNPSTTVAGSTASTVLSYQQPENGVSNTLSTTSISSTTLQVVNSSQLNTQTARKLPFTTSFSDQNPVQAQSTLASKSVTSSSLLTPQVSSALTSQNQTAKVTGAMDKCKFYLLKVDGKNILIPVNANQSQPPTAFVVSNDVAQKAVRTSKAGTSAQSIITTQKTMPFTKVSVPKLVSSATSPKPSTILPKPTATIIPSVSPSVKPILNNGKTESVSHLEKTRASFKAVVSSKVVPTPQEISAFHMVGDPSTSDAKTVSQTIDKVESDIVKPADKDTVGKRNDTEFSVKSFFDDVAAATVSQQSSSEVQQTVLETVIEKTKGIREQEEEKNLPATDDVTEKIQCIREQEEEDLPATDDVTEKTLGIREQEEEDLPVTDDVTNESETLEKEKEEEKPFSEGVTHREEKLRKLKELLREKQKAVEAVRANRLKDSDN